MLRHLARPHLALRQLTAIAATVALATTLAGHARAQGDGDGMRRPERLTTGVADQLLGQLAPDGHTIVFVSNRNTTNEIYRQAEASSGAKLLFDEGADVSWPRISPDGKRILYVSFRDDAAGQLCVRDLPDRKRRCLGNAGALQAQWINDSRIALLARSSVEGDLGVLDVRVGRKLTSRPLYARNLSSPAVSPDGRWLVYVPVERYVEHIGPGFAARAARQLEAVRIDQPGAKPLPLPLDLPGLTSQPTFSVDGRWLYVTQFLNDSNQDGEVDAADHGVLFRVPFEPSRDDAPARATAAAPEQLTDASWNCQYPSPAAKELIATCSRANDLDVYTLPLDGVVPFDWSATRLRLEIDLSTRVVEQLLLYRHLLQIETEPTARRSVMMTLLTLHLDADEFDSADFYAKKIKAKPDKQTAGVASALLVLIEHRRALRARERGRTSVEFVADSRRRLEKLGLDKTKNPAAMVFRRVVRSEIADSIGDKEAARVELERSPVEEVTLLPVVEAYHSRADALYRQLDDRDALVAACRRLATHPTLPPDEKLRYARATARALVRGLPFDEAEAVLTRERAAVDADSELAFAFELSQALLQIRNEDPPKPLREALVALYARQTRRDRQRAVVLDGVQRASELEAEKLVEALAQRYVDDVPLGTNERRRAERLFERVMLGRAYRRLGKGHLASARDAFAAVAKATNSLEGHVGYLDLQLRDGVKPADLEADYARRQGPLADPVLRFARAYLISRALPSLDGEAHAKAVERALADLKKAAPMLRGQAPPQVVWGAVLHEQYLQERTAASAQKANVHYLLALELVQRNPRYKALVLSQLALLQSQVGNHRIALGYLKDRDKLPVADDEPGLSYRLVQARTLLHVERDADAATAADAALAMVERTPSLAPYRALATDRAALYNLAAGRFPRALALYDTVLPLIDAEPSPRNRVVVRLAHAAAALGAGQPRRALADLDTVDGRLADPSLESQLAWAHTTPDEVLRSYRIIAAGLRANAHRAVGELDGAARALETRRDLLAQRFAKSGLDDHLRALTLIEARLADVAHDRNDPATAGKWLKSAIGHADDWVKRTGVPVHADQVDLLRFAAELYLSTGTKLQLKLSKRLRDAHDKLVAADDPALRGQERWVEIYVALLGAKDQRRAALDLDTP